MTAHQMSAETAMEQFYGLLPYLRKMTAQGEHDYKAACTLELDAIRKRNEIKAGLTVEMLDALPAPDADVVRTLLLEKKIDDATLENIARMTDPKAIALAGDFAAANEQFAQARHTRAALIRDEFYTMSVDVIRLRGAKSGNAQQEKDEMDELVKYDRDRLIARLNGPLGEAVRGQRDASLALTKVEATKKSTGVVIKVARPAAAPAAQTM